MLHIYTGRYVHLFARSLRIGRARVNAEAGSKRNTEFALRFINCLLKQREAAARRRHVEIKRNEENMKKNGRVEEKETEDCICFGCICIHIYSKEKEEERSHFAFPFS